jgi:putative membrane protein
MSFPILRTASLQHHARLPQIMLAVLVMILLGTAVAPAAGRLSWSLEVIPGLLAVGALILTYRTTPLSHLVYVGVFVHMLVLNYGGYYTYALAPLGEWMKPLLHATRNHYDRVGHFALGFFPALVFREVLLRKTPLRAGAWLSVIVANICMSVGAFWELVEWWTTLVVAGDVGTAFLGSQGDIWDAQWDMLLVLIGGVTALLLLSKTHDRAMAKVPYSEAEQPTRRA